MNTTRKLIFAVAIAVNVAAIAALSAVTLHQRNLARQTPTINLAPIVVTPANAEPDYAAGGTLHLGTIVVTPTEADWRYAEAHGVQRSVATVALGVIVVKPTADQLAEVAAVKVAGRTPVSGADTSGDTGAASLVEALDGFSPGRYLDVDAPLRVLNALVFERQGG